MRAVVTNEATDKKQEKRDVAKAKTWKKKGKPVITTQRRRSVLGDSEEKESEGEEGGAAPEKSQRVEA